MTILGTVLAFIVPVAFLILIHEWGHFFAARLFRVWVHQFALGFGPALWKRKTDEIEYSIRLLPIGGYVRMAGEDRQSEEDRAVPTERLFTSKPAWQRMIIVLAGPVMNIIAAVFIMITIVGIFGLPYLEVASFVTLSDGQPSPSEGILQIGDKIERVAGQQVYSAQQLLQIIRSSAGNPISIEISRANKRQAVIVTPVWSERDGRYIIGVNFAPLPGGLQWPGSTSNKIANLAPESWLARGGLQTGDRITSVNGTPVGSFWQIRDLFLKSQSVTLVVERTGRVITLPPLRVAGRTDLELFDGLKPETIYRRLGLFETITVGAQRSWDTMVALYTTIKDILARKISPKQAFTGPIGIATILGKALESGWMWFLSVVSVLSLTLGLFNLLPIPALDGSRIVFLIIEMIRGKPIPPEREGLVHYIGFLVLMGLILLVTYNDIMRLFGR